MEKVQLQHPEGKHAVQMQKSKYESVKQAIIESIEENGPTQFLDLIDLVKEKLPDFDGSTAWHFESVKLDLEARKVIKHDRKTRIISLV